MPKTGTVPDDLDLGILAELQRDNQQTADELAEAIGRSPSAIARRVRRLRDSKVITADVSVIAEAAVGQSLSAVVNVQFERHALKDIEAVRRELVACPNVQFYLEISGTFDIMLLVVVADMDAFNRFADSLLAGNRAVSRYETSFVKRRVKSSLALPLHELRG